MLYLKEYTLLLLLSLQRELLQHISGEEVSTRTYLVVGALGPSERAAGGRTGKKWRRIATKRLFRPHFLQNTV
ncbi:hypothetical protein SRHO_G00127210 [Serrasalmus rhombeus]